MDLKIYKINNGYKIGKKDGTRLGEEYGKSKKKKFDDGFIRIIDKKTKKRRLTQNDPLTQISPNIDPDFQTIFEIFF